MEFANPIALLLALLAIPVVLLDARNARGGVAIPSAAGLANLAPTFRQHLRRGLPLLRAGAIVLLAVAIARPQVADVRAEVPAEGIDIALALDVSSSMKSGDFGGARDRLAATKDVIREFIKGRENDRIGLVVFQEDALPLAPPTLDYEALDRVVADVDTGILPDGTGIGVGLATALNMLRDSTAASRVVILLTDGAHNTDSISPEDAADLATALRVRVYTIGVVGGGGRGPVAGQVDEARLRRIADTTGGRYFVADSAESLAEIYTEIGDLETSALDGRHFERHVQRAPWFLAAAGALVVCDLVLRATWLRRTA